MKVLFFAVFSTFLASHAAFASSCPTRIQYANGNTLKNGERFYYDNGNTALNSGRMYYRNGNTLKNGDRLYYQNGNTLKNGERLYFPNGNTLRSSATRWYYQNGNTLQNDARLYYPNGNTLKNGPTRWYWQNGNTLRNDERFYYANGNTARSNGRLYRENGTSAAGVVTLEEYVSDMGTLRARVTETTAEHYVDFIFREPGQGLSDLKLTYDDASGSLSTSFEIELDGHYYSFAETSPSESYTTMVLPTGYDDESVVVTVGSDNSVTCESSGTGPGPVFTINADAAKVDVQVKPGYDPRVVEAAIRRALQELQ